MKKGIFALCISTALATPIAVGEVVPAPGKLDLRIRKIDYYEDQVYHVNAQVGVSTHLRFSEGEVFEKWYSGDADAFMLADHKQYVSFKPVVDESETNLLILTNRRAYNFYVHIDDKNGYYGIHFEYPEEEAAEAELARLKQQVKDNLHPDNQITRNITYIGAGSDDVRPAKVFDNGTHTYFYFPERMDIPAIFRVRKDGQEVLTQYTTIDNWIVVPRVQKRWRLRLGLDALCVVNTEYTTDYRDNVTGTANAATVRVNQGV